MFQIWSKGLKINFQNRKWNYPNRKGSNFSTSGPLIKTYFTRYFTFPPRSSEWIFKKGNLIIQTGNGIISPTSRPLFKKNLLHFISFILTKELKNDLQNTKWNHPNRKWNYFSNFLVSDWKTSLTNCFSFSPRSSKLIFKTRNGIIQTGNRIISPTSGPLIKKLLLQDVSHFSQGV